MNARKKSTPKMFLNSRKFVQDKDAYVEEYRLWRNTRIVPSLIGVFEIPREAFLTNQPEEHLRLTGHGGMEVIAYDPDTSSEYYHPDRNAQVAGYTCALMTPYGKVKSIIFIREDVLRGEISDPKRTAEIDAIGKLGLLMHEMGHADDIDKSINCDHQRPSFDAVAGEAYAHTFVLKHAQRIGYQQILYGYCRNLEDDLTSENVIYRQAAKRVWESLNIPAIRRATGLQ